MKIKKFLAILLIFTLMMPGTAAADNNRMIELNPERYELSPYTELEIKSEARLKYESLLEGDYRGYEMKEKFEELFGTGYSAEDILTNYEEIFDVGKGEIDEGFLQMITKDEINIEENLFEQSFVNNENKSMLNKLNNGDGNLSRPIYEVSIKRDSNLENTEFESNLDNSTNLIDDASLDDNKSLVDNASDDTSLFDDPSRDSATDPTEELTLDNNKDASQVTASAGSGAYTFITTPSADGTSITVTVAFPTNSLPVPNRDIVCYNFATNTWEDISGYGIGYARNGTYIISGLTPGITYWIDMAFVYSGDQYFTVISRDVETPLPPEKLVTYNTSNMIFSIDQAFINVLSSARTTRFVNKHNNAYDTIYSLVGGTKPFNGNKMQMNWTRTLSSGIDATAGQPILINTRNFLSHALTMAYLNVDMTQGPIHEIGHNFDSYKWVFEGEATANILVYYYFKASNEKMALAGRSYQGTDYKTYLKSYAGDVLFKCYDKSVPYGIYSPFALTYRFAVIMDTIGTEPFRKTYEYFNNLQSYEVPATSIGKINLFIEKLRDYSDRDVLAMFTAQEKTVFGAKLGGTLAYPKVGIILIHGLAGSNLKLSGKYVWDPTKVFFEQGPSLTKMYDQIKKIYSNENGVPINSNITVSTNETAFSDSFASLKTTLTNRFSGKYSVDLFTYDWRQSNITTANQLQSHIALKGYQYVYLVAHSMGGLVSSQFMKYTDNLGKVRRLITIGTPYNGSANTLYAMETGKKNDFFTDLALTDSVMKELYINTPAMYQLYPTTGHASYIVNGGSTVSLANSASFIGGRAFARTNNGTGSVKPMLNLAVTFHSGLMGSSISSHIARTSGKAYFILGKLYDTISMVYYVNGEVDHLGFASGDGTVLINSASCGLNSTGSNLPSNVYAYSALHTELLSAPTIRLLVGNIIQDTATNSGPYALASSTVAAESIESMELTTRGWLADEDGQRIMFITDDIDQVVFKDVNGEELQRKGDLLFTVKNGFETKMGSVFPLDSDGRRVQYVLYRNPYSISISGINQGAEIKVQYTDMGYYDKSETYTGLDSYDSMEIHLNEQEQVEFFTGSNEFIPEKRTDDLESLNTDSLIDVLPEGIYSQLITAKDQFTCVLTNELTKISFIKNQKIVPVQKIGDFTSAELPDVMKVQTRKDGFMYIVKNTDSLEVQVTAESEVVIAEIVNGEIAVKEILDTSSVGQKQVDLS